MLAKNNEKNKVLVIDDHRVMTQGLTLLIKKEQSLEVSGTASSYQEALQAIEREEPHVALVDLHLGDGNGLDLVREISQSHPNILAIVLSTKDENVFAGRCIRAGAKGYVMKNKPFEIIIHAIKDVLSGKLFLSENIKQQLLQQHEFGGKSTTTDIDLLSEREFEIFQLVGEGFRQRQIADTLNISTVTVNTHCQNIKSKLHLASMSDLVSRSCEWFKTE